MKKTKHTEDTKIHQMTKDRRYARALISSPAPASIKPPGHSSQTLVVHSTQTSIPTQVILLACISDPTAKRSSTRSGGHISRLLCHVQKQNVSTHPQEVSTVLCLPVYCIVPVNKAVTFKNIERSSRDSFPAKATDIHPPPKK